MIKKFVGFAVVAVAFAFAFTASAYQTPLTLGSSGPAVKELQMALSQVGAGDFTATGFTEYFGPVTQAAVKAYQLNKGITPAVGYFGPITNTALMADTSGSAGNQGNCPSGYVSQTPSASNGFVSCVASSGSGSGALSGGAGDLTITQTTIDVESSVKEGETENLGGLKLEADGSDIQVSSVKVTLEHSSGTGSTRPTKYLDEAVVMLGDEEVGSMDISDFSKDGSVYSKSIPLSGAVVSEDDTDYLYVALTAKDPVDNIADEFDLDITQVRWEDATGAIFSDAPTFTAETFGFDDVSADDGIKIKSSTSDPDAANLVVEDTSSSEEYLIGAFTFDVEDDSSDITVYELPVVLTFAASGNTTDDANADSSENLVDEVRVEIDGDDYTAEFDSESMTNGVGTGTYIVDEEFTLGTGNTVVKIYATFNEQENNYGSGATVIASVTGSDIDAEGEDSVTVTSSFTGEEHTLITTGAAVTFVSDAFTEENVTDSIDGTISITMNIEAVGEDVVFADDGSDFTYAVTGATETDAVVSCTRLTASSGDFTIPEGDDKNCKLSVKFDTTTGFVKLTVTDVAGTAVSNMYTDSF